MSDRNTVDTKLFLAWFVSLIATLGSLFIGEVLGREPCVLCWYQRSFMFPLSVVLGVGIWYGDPRVGRYGAILAVLGGGIALWHLGLYWGLIPEAPTPCSATGPSCTGEEQKILGFPIALMSFASFALIATLSTLSVKGLKA